MSEDPHSSIHRMVILSSRNAPVSHEWTPKAHQAELRQTLPSLVSGTPETYWVSPPEVLVGGIVTCQLGTAQNPLGVGSSVC